MSSKTDKELQLARNRVSLIRHYGTPQQRAYGTCQDYPTDRAALIVAARNAYGEDVPLTFLRHVDGETEPATLLAVVPEPQPDPTGGYVSDVLAGLAAAGAR